MKNIPSKLVGRIDRGRHNRKATRNIKELSAEFNISPNKLRALLARHHDTAPKPIFISGLSWKSTHTQYDPEEMRKWYEALNKIET